MLYNLLFRRRYCDIVTHLIKFNKSLTELCPPNGGNFGSNEINRLFLEEIIYKIFGCKDFKTYSKKYKEINQNGEDEGVLFNDWAEFERKIKDFKEGADLIKMKQYFPISCDLLKDIFNDNIDINDLVNNYNDSCNDDELKLEVIGKKKWIINFPYKIMYNFIKKQANSICEIIKNILESSDEEINSIILVGGYSSNDILISEIKQEILSLYNINFLKPERPYLSVMEGAVYFGLDSNKIVQRKAKYTFGIKANLEWNEKLHYKKGKKYCSKIQQKYCCEDCFLIFFRINQDLELGQEIVHKCCMIFPRYSDIEFYKTLKVNPIFIDEDGIEKIGEMTFDAGKDYPLDERACKIIIRIGGTFYDIKVKHLKSGKTLRTKFEFN